MTHIVDIETVYDTRHGGPFDRGSSDSYYGRRRNPHYYVGSTGQSKPIMALTIDELDAYHAGYDFNELAGNKKDYD
jgi:hypothetical protein